MRFVIDFIYLLAAAAISPLVVYRMARHNRYRTGWANRFGKIARKEPGKKCIWIHAVSVGEVNAAKTLVEQLQDRLADFEIVISATTDTGFARANDLFAAAHTVFYFPLDFSCIMRHAFNNIRPALCLLMELEVWPNFVQIADTLNIPVVVINGRISDTSFSKYKIIKPIAEKFFRKLTLVLAQTDRYAERFKKIGTVDQNVVVTGSLKYDTAQITNTVKGADDLAVQLNIKNEDLWVAGGTGNDEEKILLNVYRRLQHHNQFRNLRLAIVPRKPERFAEVGQLIKQAGFAVIRYSKVKDNQPAPKTDSQTVILGDTMGDLRKFYSLATIIFVGRSLVPMGGSDMIEAAALGKCTLFGPHTYNFVQTVDALLDGDGAIMVKDEQDLLETIQKCLSERDFATRIAQNGQHIIKKNQGATAKTIDQIITLLSPD